MQFSLEKEALFASCGYRNDRINVYLFKLNQLYEEALTRVTSVRDPITKAKLVFNWLWEKKPSRYQPSGNFRLNDVIDAQISNNSQVVGNCLGLTLLYNCLLKKMGINVKALYLEHAFGIGPHVLTVLQKKKLIIDIENIMLKGFDYKGHLSNPSRILWRDKELVADIYHSLGNEFFQKGELNEALRNYNQALKLNPQYEKAKINKAILLNKMGPILNL